MVRECPKCGATKKDATFASNERCPSCGFIFAMARPKADHQQEHRATIADWIEKLLWAAVALGSVNGIYWLLSLATLADSSPKQAAGAAIALGSAAVPYCLARAFNQYRRLP